MAFLVRVDLRKSAAGKGSCNPSRWFRCRAISPIRRVSIATFGSFGDFGNLLRQKAENRHTSGTGSFRAKNLKTASEGRSGHGDVFHLLIPLFPTRTTMCLPFWVSPPLQWLARELIPAPLPVKAIAKYKRNCVWKSTEICGIIPLTNPIKQSLLFSQLLAFQTAGGFLWCRF